MIKYYLGYYVIILFFLRCSPPTLNMDCPEVTASVVSPYIQEHTYIQEQTYVQAPSYIHSHIYQATYTQEQSAIDMSQNVQNYSPVHTSPYHQQSLHKKGSLRKEDVCKRNRVQTMYELSQDLLDKQIEVLERKYGGSKARRAAVVIQRAFRRYTLLKKFAAITAMAKMERRASRRLLNNEHVDNSQNVSRTIIETDKYDVLPHGKQFDK